VTPPTILLFIIYEETPSNSCLNVKGKPPLLAHIVDRADPESVIISPG
jgi:hypothetical protein